MKTVISYVSTFGVCLLFTAVGITGCGPVRPGNPPLPDCKEVKPCSTTDTGICETGDFQKGECTEPNPCGCKLKLGGGCECKW